LRDGGACVCTQCASDHELAGGYLHVLDRACECGHAHGQYTPPTSVEHGDRRHRRDHRGGARAWGWDDLLRTTDYAMRSYATGEVIAVHRRFDLVSGGKDFRWFRGGTAGLHGLPEADLPLYRPPGPEQQQQHL
jgi:hypothetical protein